VQFCERRRCRDVDHPERRSELGLGDGGEPLEVSDRACNQFSRTTGDLQANAIPFVGQYGVRPLAMKPQPVAARSGEFDPKKPSIVTLVWSEAFDFNRAALSPEVRAKIDADVLPKLKDFAEIRYINVQGHSDLLGSPTYNQELSEKRAAVVRDYLVAQGASADKIEIYGYGKTMPVKSCRDEKDRRALIECLAPNRRVQIEIQGLLRASSAGR